MKTLGIICEYNPFHNGHAYQIRQARKQTGADEVICVMSGNYVQRGEAAVTDKWYRTRMALEGGADLVIELPTLFAMSGAESFARAGIRLLSEAGAQILSFGCETADLPLLRQIASVLNDEPEAYQTMLREYLKQGESFARARAKALAEYLPEKAAQTLWTLEQPGAILGIEYLKAMKENPLEVCLIERKGSAHRDEKSLGEIASASAIRAAIRAGAFPAEAVPPRSAAVWNLAQAAGRSRPRREYFEECLYTRLAQMEPWQLAETPEAGEGLENRILEQTRIYRQWEELVRHLTSRRYAAARIRRLLMNVCLGISQETRYRTCWEEGPAYLRILGIGPEGEELLSRISRQSALPILTKPAVQLSNLTAAGRNQFLEEVRYTDLYMLSLPSIYARIRGLEYREPILKNMKKIDKTRKEKKIE